MQPSAWLQLPTNPLCSANLAPNLIAAASCDPEEKKEEEEEEEEQEQEEDEDEDENEEETTKKRTTNNCNPLDSAERELQQELRLSLRTGQVAVSVFYLHLIACVSPFLV